MNPPLAGVTAVYASPETATQR